MKIIIELPDKEAEFLMNTSFIPIGFLNMIHESLNNGKPLPKCHGDLIDRRSFRENIDMCLPFTKYWQDHNPVLNMAKSELLLCLESEPTIIEADGGEEDENKS